MCKLTYILSHKFNIYYTQISQLTVPNHCTYGHTVAYYDLFIDLIQFYDSRYDSNNKRCELRFCAYLKSNNKSCIQISLLE